MIWQDYVILALLISIAWTGIGVLLTVFLFDQTPYAIYPTTLKIFGWPLLLFAMVFG